MSGYNAMGARVLLLVMLSMPGVIATTATAARAAGDGPVDTLERAVTADPEDLRACADYRQRIIAAGDYDRAIKLLGRLSDRPGSGPNVFMSLALAYVDKVPAASPFRRIFLGRDATKAVTQSIDRRESLVAYYIRGVIALYYPEVIFHKSRGGIADLEHALGMLATLPVQPYHARVYISLGDGYWKVKDLVRAQATWSDGLKRFPSNDALRQRLAARGADLDRLVEHALDPATRVDTSLRELFATASAP